MESNKKEKEEKEEKEERKERKGRKGRRRISTGWDYEDLFEVNIHGEVFDKDFDEVGWEPEEIDDSDEEMAEFFGMNERNSE